MQSSHVVTLKLNTNHTIPCFACCSYGMGRFVHCAVLIFKMELILFTMMHCQLSIWFLLAKMVTYSGVYITDDMSREHEHATRALLDIVNKVVSGSRKDGGEPVILPSNMSNNDVKLHTGFPSLFILLAFVVILCDGSIANMTEKVTNLTWYEEWIVYFEWVWATRL